MDATVWRSIYELVYGPLGPQAAMLVRRCEIWDFRDLFRRRKVRCSIKKQNPIFSSSMYSPAFSYCIAIRYRGAQAALGRLSPSRAQVFIRGYSK